MNRKTMAVAVLAVAVLITTTTLTLTFAQDYPTPATPAQLIPELQADINVLTEKLNTQVGQLQTLHSKLMRIVLIENTPIPVTIPAQNMTVTPQESYIFLNTTSARVGDVVGFSGVVYLEGGERDTVIFQYANGTIVTSEITEWSISTYTNSPRGGKLMHCLYLFGPPELHLNHTHDNIMHSHYLGVSEARGIEDPGHLDCVLTQNVDNSWTVSGSFTVAPDWVVGVSAVILHAHEEHRFGNTGTKSDKWGYANTPFAILPPAPTP